MPQKNIQTSTLNLLARLICPKGSRVFVSDPENRLNANEAHYFFLEGSAADLSGRLEAAATSATDTLGTGTPWARSAATCVFNLSNEQLNITTPGWLVEFDAFDTYPGMDSRTWSYINSPDGSPRW